MSLTAKQRELVEKLGVFHQQQGLPPAEGRILALFLVSDEVELTFDRVREELSMSKSATSTALNTLLLTDKLIYKTRPGDRKRYFTSNIIQWQENTSEAFSKLLSVNKLLQEVLELRSDCNPEFNAALQNLIDFLNYLSGELPKLYNSWKDRRDAQQTLNNNLKTDQI
jgi:DNA-binding transcriptional regulator GbsR (MarR family)